MNNRFAGRLAVIAFICIIFWPLLGCVASGEVTKSATKIPVLMYHGLLTEAENKTIESNSSIIPVENFEEQMHYLAEHDYHMVTAKEMDDFLKGEINLPPKSVMIQFDDGLRSVYRYALPIMQKYELRGIANIITSRTEMDYGAEWDPDRNQYMDQEMLDEVSSVFELQSHTNELHFLDPGEKSRLILVSQEDAIADLQASQEKLSKYGDVTLLAYPFGQFSSNIVKLVKEAGFTMAFTTEKGYVKPNDDPYQLNRIGITPDMSLEKFEEIVKGEGANPSVSE
ncbi:polysaccharide deacetylase family protein [Lentibacillus sp. Marseille-P4043]|uniref:polysaccharide deacetylase family protein n=1 Tax=Lentibacillus sp. Marseille-P4043 TaxID=2040293 RepID=UPI000D0BDCC0|nr:polysaccharide deacetylase family protein [Lentibacillus sp. Marseille-P4043]